MRFYPLALGILCASFSIGQEMNSFEGNYSSFRDRSPKITEELLLATPVEYQSHPEFGVLPYDAPCENCFELIHERTDSTRKYLINHTNGNQFATQKALGILNFKGSDNLYYEFNKKLTQKASELFVSDNKHVISTFDLANNRTKLSTEDNDDIKFNQIELVFHSAQNTIQSFGTANWSNYTVGEDGIRIIDAWPHIDIEMINTFYGIKTNYIIKENLQLGDGDLLFIDQFDLPNNFELTFADPINNLGDVLILDGNGQSAFEISEAYGMDATSSKEHLTFFNYIIDENKLGVEVSSTFLNNEQLVYPLIIDPNVSSTNTLAQASITGSRYNASCNFTNSCDYILNVPSPVNATINNVTFSMSYNAYGACWLLDGAMRIAYNGCLSPSAAGFYWYCNAIGGGNCNGANISIYSDIASCIPAPACGPFNMPFTMQFFRSCYGSGGCSNNCIQASTPFSVTVFGTNLQTLGNTATGNGSQTISPITCSGTTNLNPAPNNGVPGYTYSWSTGATTPTTTVPSYGSSPVTCTVTDACGVSRLATFIIICPLGIEYKYISANKKANRTVEIEWETIEENNNDFFTLFKSYDGISFEAIAVVSSKGVGDFNYSVIDPNSSLSEVLYYKLMNTSLNGESETSTVFKVDFSDSETDLAIVPNPTSGMFHLKYNVPYTGIYTIDLADALGKIISSSEAELKIGNVYLPYDLRNYPKGIYTVSIRNKTNTVKQRVVIQ